MNTTLRLVVHVLSHLMFLALKLCWLSFALLTHLLACVLQNIQLTFRTI